MSFLNNLAKGFVRSAVNQVGRDGGKVISQHCFYSTLKSLRPFFKIGGSFF